jgi:hypothetical protein
MIRVISSVDLLVRYDSLRAMAPERRAERNPK